MPIFLHHFFCITFIAILSIFCQFHISHSFRLSSSQWTSNWSGSRLWIGPDWYANPLSDWSLKSGSVFGVISRKRSLCVLPLHLNLSSSFSSFSLQVTLDLSLSNNIPTPSAFGFQIGRVGRVNDFRNALIYPTSWIDAVVTSSGTLIIRRASHLNTFINSIPKRRKLLDFNSPILLTLTSKPKENSTTSISLTLSASQRNGTFILKIGRNVNRRLLHGGICLTTGSGSVNIERNERVAFRNFIASGEAIEVKNEDNERKFGPLLWTMYTLSSGVLRLQAQLAPFKSTKTVTLWTKDRREAEFKLSGTAKMDVNSRTALFTIPNWNSRVTHAYQVRMSWRLTTHIYSGIIRKEPSGKKSSFRIIALSCDKSYAFPLPKATKSILEYNPDMLFFAGDQIYEDTAIFGVARKGNVAEGTLDFLRKVMLWGWTWRSVMKDRPTIAIPDDHDVLQGNLWGAGGISLTSEINRMKGNYDWESGGFLMPGPVVHTVRTVFTGALPTSPARHNVMPIGIQPYFTNLEYAGLSIAVLEDRTFKTGPLSYSTSNRFQASKGHLLGISQERFLNNWSSTNTKIKIVLSQTPFSKITTHAGPSLFPNTNIYDSGAWPPRARNRVVRIMCKSNIFSIHGDQHLGMLYKEFQGTKCGHWGLSVPGVANGFPRAWIPRERQKLRKRGRYLDDAGNILDIVTVANWDRTKNLSMEIIRELDMNVDQTLYNRASGFGVIDIDKSNNTAKVSIVRVGGKNNEVFQGFPQVVKLKN